MKIIVTGATGFIGGGIVRQASLDPAITTIFTLSRRPLPAALAQLPKVTSIIHQDFSEYPEEVLKKLRGAEACIWMIGSPRPKGDPRVMDIGFTQAASAAFTAHLQPHIASGRPFRFVYTSGIASVKDKDKSLWFGAEARQSRGEAELNLLEFAKKNKGKYEALIPRLGFVWTSGMLVWNWDWSIKLEVLSLAMLELAKKGGESRILENRELVEMGRRLVNSY